MVFPDALPCATCGGTLRAGICPRCLITGALAEDEDAGEETPAWLGDYELLNEIARGGMGVVWRARQRRLNRVVALKLLRESSLPGESGARRFRIEAEAAAALRHPHIVHVYEVGETGGRWFLSMELLAGSLAEKLRAGHLSPREAAGLLAKIARAVQHAHDRGILHRDLKPANILLDEAGEPRVSDFGLARLEARPDDLTVSGAALGTPAYMSPEQAAGKHREITTLSDVHGLGTILYEALTGRLPFRGESQLAVLRRVTEEEPARPSAGTPGIDRDLDTICLRCLQKEPARRYPSALALAEDLDRWARGEPIMARRAGTVERLWKWARRRPAAAALWIVAVLVLAGGIAGAALYTVRLERERAAALHRVSRQHVQTALGLMESGEWHRALLLLAEAVEMGTGDAGRDRVNRLRFECLARQSPRLAALWFHEGDAPRQAVFSAGNGALVLFQGRRARLHDAATGLPLGPPLESAREIVAGDVSADGTRVILGDNENHYTLWDPIAGRIIARGEGRLCPVSAVWSLVPGGDLWRRALCREPGKRGALLRCPDGRTFRGGSAAARSPHVGDAHSGRDHRAQPHGGSLLPSWLGTEGSGGNVACPHPAFPACCVRDSGVPAGSAPHVFPPGDAAGCPPGPGELVWHRALAGVCAQADGPLPGAVVCAEFPEGAELDPPGTQPARRERGGWLGSSDPAAPGPRGQRHRGSL